MINMNSDSHFDHKMRSGVRHEVRCEARIEPLDEHQQLDQPDTVVVCDIAHSGVMLHCDKAMDKGSTWRLRLIDGGCVITSLPVLIRYCQAEGSTFRIGAQLIFEPAVLKQLGVHENESINFDDESAFDISFQVAFDSP